MGVDRTDYLMFGAKLDFDAVDHDKHVAMIEGRPDAPFDLIVDGMGGKYAMAGKVIAKSDEYDGLEFTEITPDLLPANPAALKATIDAAFEAEVPPLKLYLFSHYH